VNLTTENTAIVLDSTSDYPEAPARFPNMRFVPLYVRFGDETYRDYVELGPAEFYEKLRDSPVTPATTQPTPQDFVTAYEELAAYARIYSLHLSSKVSGTFQSAELAAREIGDKVRPVDTLTASLAIGEDYPRGFDAFAGKTRELTFEIRIPPKFLKGHFLILFSTLVGLTSTAGRGRTRQRGLGKDGQWQNQRVG